MVLPGKKNALAFAASISLILGGIAVSTLTEYTFVGSGITAFGFVVWFVAMIGVMT